MTDPVNNPTDPENNPAPSVMTPPVADQADPQPTDPVDTPVATGAPESIDFLSCLSGSELVDFMDQV